jgi:hypothetical protein
VVEDVVRVTLTLHVVGDVNVIGRLEGVRHDVPVTVNGELALTLTPEIVTDPLPGMMLTVTFPGALVGAVTGGGVTAGIPKESEAGETETVCAHDS